MRALARIGVVLAGYAGAFLIAWAITAAYVASTSGPDRQAYGMMYAFGDDLLFLAVFTMAGVPATGAALYFLRPYAWFWRALSAAALTVAITGLAIVIDYVAARMATTLSVIYILAPLAPLRILAAPLFGLLFFVSTLFAPKRMFRMGLGVAALSEAVIFACGALQWLQSRGGR